MIMVHPSDDLLTRRVKSLSHAFWHQLPWDEVTEKPVTLTLKY